VEAGFNLIDIVEMGLAEDFVVSPYSCKKS
jgi:hypothetical protein